MLRQKDSVGSGAAEIPSTIQPSGTMHKLGVLTEHQKVSSCNQHISINNQDTDRRITSFKIVLLNQNLKAHS